MKHFAARELSDDRLERALFDAAWVVARYGSAYAPLFEKLERAVKERRRRADPVSRARQLLAHHAAALEAAPLKAIR